MLAQNHLEPHIQDQSHLANPVQSKAEPYEAHWTPQGIVARVSYAVLEHSQVNGAAAAAAVAAPPVADPAVVAAETVHHSAKVEPYQERLENLQATQTAALDKPDQHPYQKNLAHELKLSVAGASALSLTVLAVEQDVAGIPAVAGVAANQRLTVLAVAHSAAAATVAGFAENPAGLLQHHVRHTTGFCPSKFQTRLNCNR